MSGGIPEKRWGSLLRLVPNKRELLARAFGGLGLLSLLERVLRSRRPGLVVLTYHRIAERAHDPFYHPVISASPEAFASQMDWLRERATVVSLDELAESLARGSPWNGPRVLVTFDDGYRDNCDVAVPILRERGIAATFFLPTLFMDSPRLTWWDHVAYVVQRTDAGRIKLERGISTPIEIDLESMQRAGAIRVIIDTFLDDRVSDPGGFLAELDERAAVRVDESELGRRAFMGWDEAKRMVNDPEGRFSIGSHTHSHRRLGSLDEEAQLGELDTSKRILETRLGRTVSALAYPYGWAGTFTERTKILAREAGYELAFAAQEGVNRLNGMDRLEIRRLNVGGGDTAAMLRARTALHGVFGRSVL
jgi:peptidoglycan/xylan/chitin deacetylase (PgdA/CDA1 family)